MLISGGALGRIQHSLSSWQGNWSMAAAANRIDKFAFCRGKGATDHGHLESHSQVLVIGL